MEEGIDIFLPFWWITKHPPQGAWLDPEIWFNSTGCLKQCTKYEQADFSLTWDDSVAADPSAQTIGHVSAIEEGEPLGIVPTEFRQYLGIMGKEAAEALPNHRPYDCQINLQEGSTPPWGPIYPLSEEELQVLREWLKRMAERNVADTENQALHIPHRISHPLSTKTPQKGAPLVRRLPSPEPHYHSQQVPPTANAGASGPGPGSAVVHQTGRKKTGST